MQFSAIQQYTNTYPTRFAIKPRQPLFGKRIVSTISTLFLYDIITPYAMGGNVVSNPDQDVLTMVGWGMTVRLSLLAPGNATLNMQVDLGDGTFTDLDTSPVAITTSAKIQVITFPIVPCFFIRGRLTGDGSTYTYHVSLTDY
jgi:hypothetical protein